jgi:hypothetical protein
MEEKSDEIRGEPCYELLTEEDLKLEEEFEKEESEEFMRKRRRHSRRKPRRRGTN